jgi:hypothetical protein
MVDLDLRSAKGGGLLREFYERHVSLRRASAVAEVERGKATGEFSTETDAELLIDAIFAPLYYRLLLRFAPLTEKYGNDLIDQVLLGVRMKQKLSSPKGRPGSRRKSQSAMAEAPITSMRSRL